MSRTNLVHCPGQMLKRFMFLQNVFTFFIVKHFSWFQIYESDWSGSDVSPDTGEGHGSSHD